MPSDTIDPPTAPSLYVILLQRIFSSLVSYFPFFKNIYQNIGLLSDVNKIYMSNHPEVRNLFVVVFGVVSEILSGMAFDRVE